MQSIENIAIANMQSTFLLNSFVEKSISSYYLQESQPRILKLSKYLNNCHHYLRYYLNLHQINSMLRV